MNYKEVVVYWSKTAKHDHDTMLGLRKLKRYSDCLFFGHITLEKILKALVVEKTKKQAPRVHDLVHLHDLAKLNLDDEDVILLKEVNNFNIATRYPDFKLEFYKVCTKDFTEKYYKRIVTLYNKLCQKLK
ncbi:MAG: HEPN domain-containing protein [Candidatus Magasanikbacteria bacterium]